ncbi:MAG: SDR family NAD(P)-dependent oxidoreductase [Pseudomonadota bacterium]
MRAAVITGASAGLGAEFARQLVRRGYHLLLVARRQEKLETLAAELIAQYPHALINVFAADLSELEAPQAIFDEVNRLGLKVDYLINNAGSGGPNLLENEWSEQQAYMQLMLASATHLCHLFLPGMQERRMGRVINVASVAGRIIQPGDMHYGPMKAYLIALSEGLHHLRKEGVHVSALCPGFTHTDFHLEPDLAAMKASTPAWVWYDADVVVREGLDAVDKGRAVCISGRLYRWADPFLRSRLARYFLQRAAR